MDDGSSAFLQPLSRSDREHSHNKWSPDFGQTQTLEPQDRFRGNAYWRRCVVTWPSSAPRFPLLFLKISHRKMTMNNGHRSVPLQLEKNSLRTRALASYGHQFVAAVDAQGQEWSSAAMTDPSRSYACKASGTGAPIHGTKRQLWLHLYDHQRLSALCPQQTHLRDRQFSLSTAVPPKRNLQLTWLQLMRIKSISYPSKATSDYVAATLRTFLEVQMKESKMRVRYDSDSCPGSCRRWQRRQNHS